MTDEELAREVSGHVLKWERERVEREVKAVLARVRLEEAKLIRDEYLDQGGWELVNKHHFDEHIAALEQAAGGSAAGSGK